MSRAKHADRTEALRLLKPYSVYKDSGVEWLGEIPEHWKESKVKFLGRYVNGYAFKPEDWSVAGLPIIRIQNLTNPEAAFNRCAGDVDPRYRVTRGDILISWSASLGLFIWDEIEDGWLNQHIFKVVLREEVVDRRFFTWLGDWFIRELQKETHGSTMTHLTNSMFGGFRVDLPPLEEQRAIAAFLDRETARLDALVAKKEQLIELLQEQRTALLTRAVTKGLDPNVPMKDSDVEWLGEIPAHWEVNRTKFAARLRSGHTPSRQHPEYWQDCTIPWFGLADVWQIRDGEIEYVYETAEKISQLGLANSAARLLPKGTVILSRTASVGFAAILGIDMATTQDFVNWVCGPTLRPEFLLYVFRSMAHEFRRLTMGSTHQTIYMPDVGGFSTPIPPVAEQDRIVTVIRKETARIDALLAKVRDAIDRLKELRTALISAAVTGKIDVREVA